MIKMPVEGHLDDPETTTRRKEIILSKPFLNKFYKDCYSFFKDSTENVPKGVRLEIGSGAGFLQKYISNVFKSDIQQLSELDLVCSSQNLPFKENKLSAIYMLNVLHHVPDAGLFFREARRCLKPGGALVMIEPASTLWGDFIYKHFHNENFDKGQKNWKLAIGGPLTNANGAIPWIIFERDRDFFVRNFPELVIRKIDYFSPFTYLLSGGFSYKQLLPELLYPFFQAIEKILSPCNRLLGLFMRIKLLCIK